MNKVRSVEPETSVWPFSRAPLLEDETMAWHLDAFEWLVASFAAHRDFAETRLILPAPGFFRFDHEIGHALAERLFRQVEAYCNLSGPPLTLIPHDFIPDDADAPIFGRIQHGRHAMATYTSGRDEIRYLPALLRQPPVLISTFAHELGHHLLRSPMPVPPPVDDDQWECLTDLAAVYLGFGVFLANSAFNFVQHSDTLSRGWTMERRGYLPEADHVFATALFIAVRGIDPVPALACLKPHLASQLKHAARDLAAYGTRIGEIRASASRIASPL